jgi:hypothetical protein
MNALLPMRATEPNLTVCNERQSENASTSTSVTLARSSERMLLHLLNAFSPIVPCPY